MLHLVDVPVTLCEIARGKKLGAFLEVHVNRLAHLGFAGTLVRQRYAGVIKMCVVGVVIPVGPAIRLLCPQLLPNRRTAASDARGQQEIFHRCVDCSGCAYTTDAE